MDFSVTMKWLGSVSGDRDNNFNLIRMVAAAAVLVSHAYPIALGAGAAEPLEGLIGHSLGWVAVDIFFVISGFLIARSFDRSRRVEDWFAARFMRLFPGLFVVVSLTALVLGPLTTDLPLGAYFSSPAVGTYVVRNVTLFSLQYELPGVFAHSPYPGAINGSLWTLIHEVLCYMGVLFAGLWGILRRPRWMAAALAAYLAVYAMTFIPAMGALLPSKAFSLRDLSLPFALGMGFYVWRDRIPLRWEISAGLAALAALLHGTPVFTESFILWLGYTVMVVAYLPGGVVRRYNELGDYSYGMYVYAFPAQQLAVHLFGPLAPWQNMAIAFPAALFCAVLSWRWIEKPSLAARHRVADALAWRPTAPTRR